MKRGVLPALVFAIFAGALGQTTAAGTLAFSTNSLSFGSVTVGSNATLTVTLKNSGTSALTISSETVNASGFTTTGMALPRTLGAGSSTTLSVHFAPTSTGLHSGYIAFGTGGITTVNYSVSGTGVTVDRLSATPSSVAFGAVSTGITNSQTIQIKNGGGSNLTISSATVNGAGFSATGITIPKTLAPGQTTSFTIAFSPLTSGSASGNITFKTTASDSTYVIGLSGSGVTAARSLSVSSSSLNFGNEVIGGTATQTITVKNTGNAGVTVSSVSVSGAGFSFTGGLAGSTLDAGQSALLTIQFSPSSTGSVGGKITLASNADNSPSSIVATGTGVSSSSHVVKLSWAASPTLGVLGYHIYRSTTAGGAYTRLSSTVLTVLSYSDAAVNSGATYYYVVTAVGLTGSESAYSTRISATIP